jgi:hypothetical protein
VLREKFEQKKEEEMIISAFEIFATCHSGARRAHQYSEWLMG